MTPRLPAFVLWTASVLASAGAEPAIQPTVNFLRITMESVKPGQTPSLLRDRRSSLEPLRQMQPSRSVVGLTSVTGTEDVWYLSFYDKLAAIEDDRVRLEASKEAAAKLEALGEREGGRLAGKDEVVALFYRESSYRPDFDWSKVRYLDVISLHVRPGHHLQFLEMRKISVDGHLRGGIDTHLPMYKAITGLPGNTYLILRPLQSLSGHDDLRALGFGEPLTDAENRRMIELQADAVDHQDEQFFRVDPGISWVTSEWAATDPAFWKKSAR